MATMRGEFQYRAWGELLYSVQTGSTAFTKVYGQPVFDYLSQHPAQARLFDETMVGVHGRETAAMLVIPGGEERTEDEYRKLYQAAGLRLTRIVSTPAEVSVIEGKKL